MLGTSLPGLSANFDGVLRYCNGRLYAAAQNAIWMSPNEGTSWILIGSPFPLPTPRALDVDFIDSLNGVVASFDAGIYYTSTAGAFWTPANLPGKAFNQAKFVGSPSIIVATEITGAVWISMTGGAGWNKLNPPVTGEITEVLVRQSTHTIYMTVLNASVAGGYSSKLLWSSDYGVSWTVSASTFAYDCYGFAIDSCDDKRFTIINEGTAAPEASLNSRIFYSWDKGLTFNPTAINSIYYYTGCVQDAIGGTLYTQTTSIAGNGVLRSIDHGVTWTMIGGPSAISDSHLIAVKDDNTLFGFDAQGNFWRTYNSGGDSVRCPPNIGTLTATVSSLFNGDTVVDCDSPIVRSFRYGFVGCLRPAMTGVSISGAGAAAYTATVGPGDSVHVKLTGIGQHGSLPAILSLHAGSCGVVNIDLEGAGRGVPFVCTVAPGSLTDSLTLCDSPVYRTIVFSPKGCFMPKIVSQTIVGDSAYTIEVPVGDSVRSGDTAVIKLSATTKGVKNATYRVVFADGTKIDVPLHGSESDGDYVRSFSPNTLTDTVSLCDPSVTRSIIFHARGCRVPKIVSQRIVGPQQADYSLVRPAPDSLGAQDSAVVRFTFGGFGARSASYEITFEDSTKILVTLEGNGRAEPFTYSFSPPSISDTAFVCDSPITRTIVINTGGCPQPKVISQTLVSGSEYTLLHTTADSIVSSDSVTIRFKPRTRGTVNGSFILTFADGKSITVPLSSYGDVVPFIASATPQSLFMQDSLYPCDSPITRTIYVSASGCPEAKIVSQNVVGGAATDYSILRTSSDSIVSVDSVILRFAPIIAGARDAAYVVHFENGDSISIPLLGYGNAPSTLQIATSDQSVTTLGETIHVPVDLSGLVSNQTIEVTLHYDVSSDLDYLGSFTRTGAQVDVAGESWPGRSKLLILGAMSGTICTADFAVFADTVQTPRIWFDSLAVVDPPTPCAFAIGSADSAAVSIVSGCGIGTISRFLHHGILPVVSVVPNPANSTVEVRSTMAGDATFELSDVIGVVHLRLAQAISAEVPGVLDIRSLPAGMYVLRVSIGTSVSSHPLLIVR